MIRAVLFDMDGLLLNTEEIYMQTNFEVCAQLGYSMTKATYYQMMGVVKQIAEQIYVQSIPGFDSITFHRLFDQNFQEKLNNGDVRLKKGAHELLEYLEQNKVLKAIATSSSSSWTHQLLERMNVKEYFNKIITGEMVENSKPHPDIYLYAAECLGVQPSQCLVLEDSENGIRAGKAANMRVCMIPDLISYNPSYAEFCDHVCNDLIQVLNLFK